MYISRTIHPPLLPEEKPIPTHPLHRELSLILKEIKVITDKIKDDDEAGNVENDWKFAAMVIDRLCLIGKRFNSFIFNNIIQKIFFLLSAYTFFTILATVAVLHTAPHVIVA